jgi:hypothetical protein
MKYYIWLNAEDKPLSGFCDLAPQDLSFLFRELFPPGFGIEPIDDLPVEGQIRLRTMAVKPPARYRL